MADGADSGQRHPTSQRDAGFNVSEDLGNRMRHTAAGTPKMAPARPKRARKSSHAGGLARESIRAFCAGALLTGVFAFAFFLGDGARQQQAFPPEPSPTLSAGTGDPGNEDESPFRTAAILFMPYQGDNCKQHVFDNFSGRIWFFGYVDCGAAIARSGGSGSMVWSAARVDAIRGSFRGN